MQYRARQEMLFMLNGKQNTTTAIERGTMLEAVELSSLSAREREPFVRMAKRDRQRDPNSRLLFFRWLGVVRAARAGRDLEVVLDKRRTTRRTTRSIERKLDEQNTSEQKVVATSRRRTRRARTRWEDK